MTIPRPSRPEIQDALRRQRIGNAQRRFQEDTPEGTSISDIRKAAQEFNSVVREENTDRLGQITSRSRIL